MLDVSAYVIEETATGTRTLTTDGDIATFNVGFASAGIGQYKRFVKTLGTNPSTTTYPKIIIRHRKTLGGTNAKPRFYVQYTDLTETIVDLTVSSSFVVDTISLTTGKSLKRYGFQWEVTVASTTETYESQWDFTYPFKETLLLPAVSQPFQLMLPRTVVELPIPSREGGVLQDIGSDSARLDIAGALVTTTSPNNYTADQWWDVLVGTWLEGNWQYVSSDRVSYKYQIEELTVRQDPGKVGYFEFKMRLKKVDILTATAQTYGAIQ